MINNIPILSKNDLNALKDTLTELYKNSFDYLYNLQVSSIFRKRFHYNTNQLKPLSDIFSNEIDLVDYFYLVMDGELISPKKRILFKKSNFFDTFMSQEDISNNSDIFERNYLVFIDGYLNFDTKVFIKEDKVYLCFDIHKKWDFDIEELEDHAIEVIYLSNYIQNKFTCKREEVISSTGEILIPESLYNPNNADVDFIFFNNIGINKYKFISSEPYNSYYYIMDDIKDEEIKFIAIGLDNFATQLQLNKGEKYFQLSVKDMPIATENILLFVEINGIKRLMTIDEYISLNLYYPNIYEIQNTIGDSITCLIFYNEFNNDLKYKNYSNIYFHWINNAVSLISNNELPDIIKNYKPYKFDYTTWDYIESDDYTFPLEYYKNTFKKAFGYNEEYLRDYLKKLIPNTNSISYLDISKINLNSKLVSSYKDLNTGKTVSLNESRYKFIFEFNDEEEYNGKKYFIDGYIYSPDIRFHDDQYEYLYIQKDLLMVDSLIEIEYIKPLEFTKTFQVSSIEDIVEYELTEEKFANLSSLQIKDVETDTYLSKDDYIISKIDYYKNYHLTTSLYENIDKIKISIVNEDYLNKDLELRIESKTILEYQNVETNVDTVIGTSMNLLGSMSDINRNFVKDTFRIYDIVKWGSEYQEKEYNISSEFYELNDIKEFLISFKYKRYITKAGRGVGLIVQITYDDDSIFIFDQTLENVSKLTDTEFKLGRFKIKIPSDRYIKEIRIKFAMKGNVTGKYRIKELMLTKGYYHTDYCECDEDQYTPNLIPNTALLSSQPGGKSEYYSISQNVTVDTDEKKSFNGCNSFKIHANSGNTYVSVNNVIPICDSYEYNVFSFYVFIPIEETPNKQIEMRVRFYDTNKKELSMYSEFKDLNNIPKNHYYRIYTNKIEIPKNAKFASAGFISTDFSSNIWVTAFQFENGIHPTNYTPSQDELTRGVIPYGTYRNNGSNFRIYRNGKKVPTITNWLRKIPKNYSTTGESEMLVNTNIIRNIGDKMVYDFSPIKLNRILYKKEIDKSGIIDLRGIIKKPFDLRWYEIYLNGVRLNKNMIEIITPTRIRVYDSNKYKNGKTKIITSGTFNVSEDIKAGHRIYERGINSLYNLEIFERDLNSDDEFVLSKTYDSYSEKQYQLVENKYTSIGEKVFTEQDVISDMWSEIDMEWVYFILYLNNKFINPNINQVNTDKWISNFFNTLLVPDETIQFLNANQVYKPPIICYLNPNNK